MRKNYLPVIVTVFLLVSLTPFAVPIANASSPVTITKHSNLGFTTDIPISIDTGVENPPCLLDSFVAEEFFNLFSTK